MYSLHRKAIIGGVSMAFLCNYNQQVRLKISREAEAILEDDMRSFKEPKRSTLANTILENYYEEAASSICIQLEKYKTAIDEIFSESDTKNKSDDIKILLKERKKELVLAGEKLQNLKKNSSWDGIRLRNELFNFLTNEINGSKENKYYNSLAAYLSTIIEEYARLPYIKRERIYYKSIFEDLEKAITEKKQIIISKKKTFYVLPYKIMANPLSTYSYLVGYAYRENDEKESMKPCSYRISELANSTYRIVRSKSAYLTKERKDYLHLQIAEKGVQFLSSDILEIIVKFTDKGIEHFYRQINLRPVPLEPVIKSNYPYKFKCTRTQANYYFTQFGMNAEILSPPELREEFKKEYHEANALYSKKP